MRRQIDLNDAIIEAAIDMEGEYLVDGLRHNLSDRLSWPIDFLFYKISVNVKEYVEWSLECQYGKG